MQDILRVGRSDAIYNGHSYLTKVPVMAIVPFINEYTKVGDTVVDPFAGSGMTAIAAKMSGRNAVVSDISKLGKHIGKGYLSEISSEKFMAQAALILEASKSHIGHLYNTTRIDDETVIPLNKTIWSFVYECRDCQEDINYYRALENCNWDTKNILCPHCQNKFEKRGAKYLRDEPVVVSINGINGKQIEQNLTSLDYKNISSAESSNIFSVFPSVDIPEDREMYKRSALKKWNLTSTNKFFSHRNAIILNDLWDRFEAVNDEQLKQKLKFAFTAILPRASKRYQWSKKAPLNAAIQNYYIAPVFYEWNVYDLLERKFRAIMKADLQIQDEASKYTNKTTQEYITSSADNLSHIRSNSVDLVFTDPPFGSNIFYADMNLFHEAWLGEYTDNTSEAVMRTVGANKSESKEHYKKILTGAFSEAYRILKDKGYLSVVFGNSQGSIWSVVQQALRDSGFINKPVNITILDKGQRSVKGLNSGTEKVVTLDLVVTVQKDIDAVNNIQNLQSEKEDILNIIKNTIENIKFTEEMTASHIYLDILRNAMYLGVNLSDINLSDIIDIINNKGYKISPDTGKLLLI
ncbi:DNA methylase [Photobacterium damselae subsp. damselae]|uniref:DNA methylase n=1 Tax=Photobacterium damselae subsp. damselae TaxID=85581 RepID=A0A850QL68_PHODD|nr:DNA methylase [Photobacterium damselae subsp. damselae]